jgi:hypothetical protein
MSIRASQNVMQFMLCGIIDGEGFALAFISDTHVCWSIVKSSTNFDNIIFQIAGLVFLNHAVANFPFPIPSIPSLCINSHGYKFIWILASLPGLPCSFPQPGPTNYGAPQRERKRSHIHGCPAPARGPPAPATVPDSPENRALTAHPPPNSEETKAHVYRVPPAESPHYPPASQADPVGGRGGAEPSEARLTLTRPERPGWRPSPPKKQATRKTKKKAPHPPPQTMPKRFQNHCKPHPNFFKNTECRSSLLPGWRRNPAGAKAPGCTKESGRKSRPSHQITARGGKQTTPTHASRPCLTPIGRNPRQPSLSQQSQESAWEAREEIPAGTQIGPGPRRPWRIAQSLRGGTPWPKAPAQGPQGPQKAPETQKAEIPCKSIPNGSQLS